VNLRPVDNSARFHRRILHALRHTAVVIKSQRFMILPIFANVEWPSAIVASVLIVCLTAGFVAAVMRYNSDAAMKLAGYFTGFLGLLLGTIMTYFFTREATQSKIQAVQARSEAKLRFAETQLNAYEAAADAVKTKLSPKDAEWFGAMMYKPASKEPAMGEWGKWPETPTPTPTPTP
jgi:hypothetical protein